jgi:hypothetical protein
MIGSDSGETARRRCAAERLERRRPDRRTRLLDEPAVILAVAGFEPLQQHLGRFREPLPRLVHREPEAVELDLAGATAQTQDEAAARDVVEHRDFLGHAHRVVPREHDHHRAQARALGAAGHIGQKLQHVRAHRVIGEVMLDAPDRLEAERLGQVGQPELVAIDLAVGSRLAGVLEHGRQTNVHGKLPFAVVLLRR